MAECPHTRARAGLLHTPHGAIETPVFMPVGTQATVKGLSQRDLAEDLGVRILLANTYHLYLRPGHELIRRLGGLHRFMSWPNAILTDSGGFQVFSLSGLRKITERRAWSFNRTWMATAHVHAGIHRGRATGARQRHPDGAGRMPGISGEPRVRAREHAAHGAVGAARPIAHYRRRMAEEPARRRHALFPIVQGSMFADLRRECAAALLDLDADGYAIGGLSVGEPRPLSLEMVEATEDILPRDRPRYAMGVGMPAELPEYVARGVDMMDCVLPSRNARNGYLFTSAGPRDHQARALQDDARPVDENCRVLYLYQIFPGLPSPSVPVRGDSVRGAGDAAQHPAVP